MIKVFDFKYTIYMQDISTVPKTQNIRYFLTKSIGASFGIGFDYQMV